MIKKLFSIKIEDDISHSIYVQMIQRPVVPHEIAEMFECPEVKSRTISFFFFWSFQSTNNISFVFQLSIERNIRKLLIEDKKQAKITPRYHAFGRSLSPESKRLKIIEFTASNPFMFPDDIRSGKNLFYGIDSLK